MNRLDRLIAIITVLQSRKYVTAEQIAEKFGMSIRTVYRDIKALGESGIPIGFEPAKGYFIVQGYFLPPVSFSSEEANALLLMETLTYGFTDKSIQKHYASALNKVKAVLRLTQKENLEALNDNIKLQVPERLYVGFEYLSDIQQAISTKQVIEIEYKSQEEKESTRCVEPIGLIFYAFSWHLIGWCQMRSDYRDFKLSRISKLKVSLKPFKNQQHISVKDYMRQLPVSY